MIKVHAKQAPCSSQMEVCHFWFSWERSYASFANVTSKYGFTEQVMDDRCTLEYRTTRMGKKYHSRQLTLSSTQVKMGLT
jgi:hypothetical protein